MEVPLSRITDQIQSVAKQINKVIRFGKPDP